MLLTTLITLTTTYLLFSNMIQPNIVVSLNSLSMVLSVVSKLNQAFLNYRNSSTGNLSAITLILQFLGCVARIFTSIQETNDINLVITFVATSAANGLLVLQLFYYWNKPVPKKKNE
jgi:mannose-P-dolichol utilization defect 1